MSHGDLVPGVSCDALLVAIEKVETSGGANNWPRLEPSWIPLGLTFTVQGHYVKGTGASVNDIVRGRWAKWGLASAASWGPWQILYHTAADMGFDGAPWELFDPSVSETWVVDRLTNIAHAGARTVEEFAAGWNTGSYTRAEIVPVYVAAVLAAYKNVT